MGCGNTKEAVDVIFVRDENNHRRKETDPVPPPPRKQSPPPKDPTPPPREPTPPPNDKNDDDNEQRTYNLMGGPGYFDTYPDNKDPELIQDKKETTPQPSPQPPPSPPPPAPNDENENLVKDNNSQVITDDQGLDDSSRQGGQDNPSQNDEGQVDIYPAPPVPPPDNNDEGEQGGEIEPPVPPPLDSDNEGGQGGDFDPPVPPPPPHNDADSIIQQNTDDDYSRRRGSDPNPDPGPPVPVPFPPPADDHDDGRQDDHDNDNRRQDRQDEMGGDSLVGYKKSPQGVHEKFLEFRQHPEPLDCDFAQEPTSLPFVDSEFGPSEAIKGQAVAWKRPREFCPGAVLFSDGVTRFDVGQGGAGTCWFLSTVAMLADNPEFFHRAVPKDAWNADAGYFYCYFWRYGEWERVVIDDYLPIVHDTLHWGAKSKDNDNEMWPAFLEKAFARFHGNYNSVYGGQSGDAYLALTGGCSEYIDFDKEFEKNKDTNAKKLHSRLRNAIKSGALVCTEVPAEYDQHHGLVGGHAYSLSGATTVMSKSGQPVNLVRVRNPWGHTEWTGPWQDKGGEWDSIQPGQIMHEEKDDGEFWMELDHFIKYFSGVTICSMTPDFDKDGCEDSLHVCTNMFGNWRPGEAGGFKNRYNNPRYTFFVDDEGMDSDGLIPLVVQICQKLMHRKGEKSSIRVDLCQVLAEDAEKGIYALQLLGDVTNLYKKERQMSNRYKVEPGQYVVIPSTIIEGDEKDFLIRIFSPLGLRDVRKISPDATVMAADTFEAPEVQGVDNKMRFCETRVGSWKAGYNAGGQISQEHFYCNPQIEFEIPNRGPQMVNITIMQSNKVQGNPVGVQLFDLEDGYEITRQEHHRNYLYDHHETGPRTVEGDQGKFVLGSSASITHVLEPGQRYFCIFHMDAMDAENDFSVVVRSTCSLDLKLHSF